jgi:hypothetical protein
MVNSQKEPECRDGIPGSFLLIAYSLALIASSSLAEVALHDVLFLGSSGLAAAPAVLAGRAP